MQSFLVWAGPILRRIQSDRLTLWLATSQPVDIQLSLSLAERILVTYEASVLSAGHRQIKVGEALYIQLIDLPIAVDLPYKTPIYYDLKLNGQDYRQWADDLCFRDHEQPFFVLQPRIDSMLHGSCRKPHHGSDDGLVRVAQHLSEQAPDKWPALLMLSGDQIYADDVATPMLHIIHTLLPHFQLPDEALPCSEVPFAAQLHQHQPFYANRAALLPDTEGSRAVKLNVFEGVKKPVFTTDTADNHLISLGEVLAMYMLVWSPCAWKLLKLEQSIPMPTGISSAHIDTYQRDAEHLLKFAAGLSDVRRALAHVPVAMMFDDHDITDDWNLTAAWEQAAYQHDFSKRIIGNALLGYLLCQGWGNCPEHFDARLMQHVQDALQQPGGDMHDSLVTHLLRFNQWHYQWATQPPLIVLDTRTQRWRSERSTNLPSGLMDWEAITDLQQRLIGLDAVVLVSPAPIFGVKLIEAVQRVFVWLGKPLMVDAENWMAHRGTAYAILNLFRHPKTPKHFVILSGDVHYSFVYDIQLRGPVRGPDLWQITSSGLKNEFPPRLLQTFDRLNRWLYSPRSPLNWFTRRRDMKIIPHKPSTQKPGERLLNGAGVGLVKLNEDGSPREVMQLCSDGRNVVFDLQEDEARWQ